MVHGSHHRWSTTRKRRETSKDVDTASDFQDHRSHSLHTALAQYR
ncbi:hypothetical protein COLO4_26043 [Corchorus olitorius]|uniref:Uncharacterized protein n=1 Tax=Corchorus olitorius TaxID=93759 RepID=A0A1R3HYZ3_9ROSI|nr:hypothetical protein COLO4_26043 [Corchorus olitorius]